MADRTSGVKTVVAGQSFFDPAAIANAVMTPEQEAAVRRGSCPKCMGRLEASCESGGMRFSYCKPCRSTYAVGVLGTPEASDETRNKGGD